MKVIKQGMKEIIIPAVIVMVIGTIFLSVCCYKVVDSYTLGYPIEIWNEGCEFMDFFMPLIITVPFVGTLYMKRKNRFIEYAAMRINKEEYIKKQTLAGMITSAIITFVIYFIPLLLSLFIFAKEKVFDTEYNYFHENVFGDIQIKYPLIFGFVFCLWKAFIASLFTRFGYKLSLYLDNIFAISIIPFLYVSAENLVTSILGIDNYSVVTAYVLNRLSPDAMTPGHYVYGVISFVIITSIIVKVLAIRKEKCENGYSSN